MSERASGKQSAYSQFLRPQWPAPENVVALVSTRIGGRSAPPYTSFNLAYHVGDSEPDVTDNRRIAQQALGSDTIQWLDQVHGTEVVTCVAGEEQVPKTRTGDAAFLSTPGTAAAVLTADCLPVFFASEDGTQAAVAHAGWRGLLDGVLEATVVHFNCAAPQLIAWLGPAIASCHFEVGTEVRQAFLERCQTDTQQRRDTQTAFRRAGAEGKWMADLYQLARIRLLARGVEKVYGGTLCTFCDQQHFYSYRREGRTGRMASLIYLKP